MGTEGSCKLCGTFGPLRWSHIVPNWIYRRTLGFAPNGGGPLVSIDGKKAKYDQTQLAEYLLCETCEGRMKPGEDYVSRIALQVDDGFPALETVPIEEKLEGLGFALANASILNCPLLARFVVSVIWRASVSSILPRVSLGPYECQVGEYLLDQKAPLPQRLRVLVQLISPPEGTPRFERMISEPQSQRSRKRRGFHHHFFNGVGMEFALYVGRRLPRVLDRCGVSAGRVIVTEGRRIGRHVRRLASTSAPSKKVAAMAARRNGPR